MLSMIVLIGGTRTAYIIERNISSGEITDFQDYADYCAHHYQRIIKICVELGVTHLQLPILAWQSFVERGEAYAKQVSETVKMLTNEEFDNFFKEHHIVPHFIGLETLLQLPSEHYAHQTALHLQSYVKNYSVEQGRCHVFWEVAAIPALSIAMDELPDLKGLELTEINDTLYRHYSKKIYGLEIPVPDIYIGSARNGQIKLRTSITPALTPGAETKYYFLEYPTILITAEVLKKIMDDAKQSSITSKHYDYSGGIINKTILDELKQTFQSNLESSQIIGIKKEWGKK